MRMKFKKNYPVLLCWLLLISSASVSQTNKTVLAASKLQPYGRTLIDAGQNLELISSAVHFGFSFTGKQCTIYAFINDAAGHNYLQYELDGVYQKRLKVTGGAVQPVVITAV